MGKIADFFRRAFGDMKKSAQAQHQVDKANFDAARAESRATWEEARQTPAARQAMMQEERDAAIASAQARTAAAQARIDDAHARNAAAQGETTEEA